MSTESPLPPNTWMPATKVNLSRLLPGDMVELTGPEGMAYLDVPPDGLVFQRRKGGGVSVWFIDAETNEYGLWDIDPEEMQIQVVQ